MSQRLEFDEVAGKAALVHERRLIPHFDLDAWKEFDLALTSQTLRAQTLRAQTLRATLRAQTLRAQTPRAQTLRAQTPRPTLKA